VRVQACLYTLRFSAARCNGDWHDLQHVSVSRSSLQLVDPDFNPRVAGSIPARPIHRSEVFANPLVEPSRTRRTCCFGEAVRSPVRSSASLASLGGETTFDVGRVLGDAVQRHVHTLERPRVFRAPHRELAADVGGVRYAWPLTSCGRGRRGHGVEQTCTASLVEVGRDPILDFVQPGRYGRLRDDTSPSGTA
jgi:hypothetical protein